MRRLGPDEKRAAWPTVLAAYPPYDEYQARTDRDIPVFRCTPVGSAARAASPRPS